MCCDWLFFPDGPDDEGADNTKTTRESSTANNNMMSKVQTLPLLEIYNFVMLSIALIQLIRRLAGRVKWPGTAWGNYQALGLVFFNTSILFKTMAVLQPIIWNYLLHTTETLKNLAPEGAENYDEVFTTNFSTILSVVALFILAFWTPWLITHVLVGMILYIWLLVGFCGSVYLYLYLRKNELSTKPTKENPGDEASKESCVKNCGEIKIFQTQGNQVYSFVRKNLFRKTNIRKFLFITMTTILIQMFYNWTMLFYSGEGYVEAIKIDYNGRRMRDWFEAIRISFTTRLEVLIMLL